MRFRDLIEVAIIEKFKRISGVRFAINPSYNDLYRFVAETERQQARGILDQDELTIWDAERLTHMEALQELGIPNWDRVSSVYIKLPDVENEEPMWDGKFRTVNGLDVVLYPPQNNHPMWLRAITPRKSVVESAQDILSVGYGGWIEPKGRIHEVDYEGHQDWINDNMGVGYAAFDRGWLRFVVGHSSLSLQGYYDAVKKHFRMWYPALRNLNRLHLDILDDDTLEYSGTYEIPNKLNRLRELFGGSLSESTNIGYGGWIIPGEGIRHVPEMGHTQFLADLYDDTPSRSRLFRQAFLDGLVRFVNPDAMERGRTDELNLEGDIRAIRETFKQWFPMTRNLFSLRIDVAKYDRNGMPVRGNSYSYFLPEDRAKLIADFGPEWQKTSVIEEAIDISKYGGWITPENKVVHVKFSEHYLWANKNYGSGGFFKALEAGCVRFASSKEAYGGWDLMLNGKLASLRRTFPLWFRNVSHYESVYVDEQGRYGARQYVMPGERIRLANDYGPGQTREESLSSGDV